MGYFAFSKVPENTILFQGIAVDEDFQNLYKHVKETKNIAVFAELRQLTVFQKLCNLIAENKDRWISEFQNLDADDIMRVPSTVFFDTVEVYKNITLPYS